MSSRHTELTTQLRALKLPTMAESFSDIAVKAVRTGLSHEAFLHELVRLDKRPAAQPLDLLPRQRRKGTKL